MMKQIINFFDRLADGTDMFFNINDHSLSAQFGKPNGLLSRWNKGQCVDGVRSLTLKQNCSNVLIVGPSGKGKSQVQALPTLLRADGSASYIINDSSGELSSTLPYLTSVGYQAQIIDFSKQTGLYFNPLDSCYLEDGTVSVSHIKKIAQTLLTANTSNQQKRDFWSISSADVISLVCQFVLETEVQGNRNLAFVYKLIQEYQGSPNSVEDKMAKHASEDVFQKFKAISGASENTRKSQIANCLSILSFLGDDPVLSEITSKTNIDFGAFREHPHALFVAVNPSDIKYYTPILSLFFQEFYRFAFSRIPTGNELPISMLLDEFDTLGAIADYSSIISLSRKYKIPQNIYLQSKFQLSKYGDSAQTILSNCAVKIYYGGLDIKEAQELEMILGKYEYYPDKDSKQARVRSLMTAQEIREMKDEIIVLVSGEKPLKLKTRPAYKNYTLKKRLAMELTEDNLLERESDTSNDISKESINDKN